MDTLALTIHLPEGWHGAFVAELSEIGFEAFAEEGDELNAYGPVDIWSEEVKAELSEWLGARQIDVGMGVHVLPSENWNEKWEASIRPLDVGSFVIAPTWAELGPKYDDRVVLLIDPKMSFGTGYHESTRIALRLLEGAVHDADYVLDAGTGTGVLAIAALKLGAGRALGFDIDPLAVESASENASLNGVEGQFEIRNGTVDTIEEAEYDVVVGNMIISRLRPILPQMGNRLAKAGRLVLSGVLQTEREALADVLRNMGLEIVEEATENEWWGCVAQVTD